MAWESPDSVHCEDSPIVSSVYSFAIAMWECFSYGETPWTEMTNDQVRDSLWKWCDRRKREFFFL